MHGLQPEPSYISVLGLNPVSSTRLGSALSSDGINLAGLNYPRGTIQKLVEMGVRTPETRHEGLALGIETVGCTSVTVELLRTIHGRGHHRHSEASMASIAGIVSVIVSGFSRSPIQQCPGAVCLATLDKGRNYMSNDHLSDGTMGSEHLNT